MKSINFPHFRRQWKIGATAVSFLLLLVFVVSLFVRRFNGDEGIIGEWAYWLATIGEARSMLYYSYFGEKALSLPIYHKFYAILLAGIIKLVGFEPFYLRLLSLFSFVGVVWLSKIYLNQNQIKTPSLPIIIGIFLAQSLWFNFAFVARPELLMAFFALAVFVCLKQFADTKHWKWALYAGLISGLSFYTHLNGLAIIAAGGLFLLFRFQWKAVLAYGLSAFVVASLFVVDISGSYLGLLNELAQSPDVENSSFSIQRLLLKVLTEHERFFHNAGLAVLSLTTLLSLILTWKHQKKQNTDLLIFTGLLVLSLSLLTHGKTPKYLLFYMPFMVLIILQALHYMFSVQNKTKILVISVFLLAGAGISLVDYFKDYSYFVDVKSRNQAMASQMEKGSTVLAHNGFVFGQIENFEIRSPIIFFFTKNGFNENELEDRDEYLTFAKENGYDYVAIDNLLERKEIREFIGAEQLNTGDTLSGFLLTYKSSDFLIFKRLD
jgi:hypothetical protein